MAQSKSRPTSDQAANRFVQGLAILLVEMDHEIFSMVSVCLPLIKAGQFSVSDQRMCTSTG